MKTFLTIAVLVLFTSCTIYTEKRSEVLSQAVYATAEGIKNARFEKAAQYSELAKKMAYAPKNPIPVPPIITKQVKQVKSVNGYTTVNSTSTPQSSGRIGTNVITSTTVNEEEETVLRLVIPEHLKHAKLLIENSDEWKELLRVREFKDRIEKDNMLLKKLNEDIEKELTKQQKHNLKMIEDLHKLQKEVLSKNLHIVKLYIVIVVLIALIGGGIYLRIKGIL